MIPDQEATAYFNAQTTEERGRLLRRFLTRAMLTGGAIGLLFGATLGLLLANMLGNP